MVRANIVRGLILLLVLLVGLGIISVIYKEQLALATTWVVEHIGFVGMCVIAFATDAVVTPIPPDVLLVVVATSELAEQWVLYVALLSLVSVSAGMSGYFIGKWFSSRPLGKRIFGEPKPEHREMVTRYGFWGVVLGALTPLPFSVTCWTAGILGLRWQSALAGAAFRIPRFFAYYFLVVYATQLQNVWS